MQRFYRLPSEITSLFAVLILVIGQAKAGVIVAPNAQAIVEGNEASEFLTGIHALNRSDTSRSSRLPSLA
jgi:hypothetical protein